MNRAVHRLSLIGFAILALSIALIRDVGADPLPGDKCSFKTCTVLSVTSTAASGATAFGVTTNGARYCINNDCSVRLAASASAATFTASGGVALPAFSVIGGSTFLNAGVSGPITTPGYYFQGTPTDGATAVGGVYGSIASLVNATAKVGAMANVGSQRGYWDRDAIWNGGVNARGGLTISALATPVNSSFSTSTTGGTLAAGTYYYRITATNAWGETLASTETSRVTTGATSTVTVNWVPIPGATGYKIYGRGTGAEQLLTTGTITAPVANAGGSNLISFVDDGSGAASGAGVPAVNDTGVLKFPFSTLPTCNSTNEGIVVLNAARGISTGVRTGLCLCTSDGAGSPVYAWMDLTTGTIGSTTLCGP